MPFDRDATRGRLDRRELVGAAALAAALGWGLPRAAGAQADPEALGTLTVVVGGLDTRVPWEPENSDVLMIARVDVPNRTVRAVNVPRDLYVQIPGIGYDKITRAYDYGAKAAGGAEEAPGAAEAGMALMVETVAVNFGVVADGVVLATFGGFVEIVEALGGVAVVNPYEVYDGEYPTPDYGYQEIYFPAGPLELSGEDALAFCRTRHQDGDEGRVMRQGLVLRGLLERARDPELEGRLPRLVERRREAVRTDLAETAQVALALVAPEFGDEGVAFGSLAPYLYSGYTPEGMWIYDGDWGVLPGLVQGFLDGAVVL